MSGMTKIAQSTIDLCNEKVLSIGTTLVKEVRSGKLVSALIATRGPDGQVTLVGTHNGEYNPASFTSILPLSDDDLMEMEKFISNFLNGHRRAQLSKSSNKK